VKKILVLVVLTVVGLTFSSVALANSLTCAHGSTTCHNSKPAGPKSAKAGHGTLPFTGMDLAGVAGVGGLLLLSGLTLQRVSRRRS
jgi:hypothetical protein